MNMIAPLPLQQADIGFQANLYDDGNPTRRGLHRSRRAWVETATARHVLPGTRAIEIGIGCGIFVRHIAKLGADVTAVDINPAFLVGVSHVQGVTVLLANATKPLDLGSHDLALCTEVLEHVDPSESLALLDALHRALKPDGVLVLTTPQRFSIVELMARLLKLPPILLLARKLYGAADELGHTNLLTARALKAQLEIVGFRIEAEEFFGLYLPFVAEFGGKPGWRMLSTLGRRMASLPVLRRLLWTQAYILRKA